MELRGRGPKPVSAIFTARAMMLRRMADATSVASWKPRAGRDVSALQKQSQRGDSRHSLSARRVAVNFRFASESKRTLVRKRKRSASRSALLS